MRGRSPIDSELLGGWASLALAHKPGMRFGPAESSYHFGPLEWAVMEVVWARGEISVREVAQKLSAPLAYNTVMTTLDRLYKKGALDRRKQERRFLYFARISRAEWEQKRATALVKAILAGPRPANEILAAQLVDVVASVDEAMLDELEHKIKMKRCEMGKQSLDPE